jgi:Tat protein translocase TatB subunit
MLDMSWGEIMVIGAVALIVIGPKDLPKALRTIGQMTGKLRRMAAEFQGQFNEAMREAELDEVKKQLQGVNDSVSSVTSTSFNPIQTIRDELKTSIEAPAPGTIPRSRPSWRGGLRIRPIRSSTCRLRRLSTRRRRSPNPCGARPSTRPNRPPLPNNSQKNRTRKPDDHRR